MAYSVNIFIVYSRNLSLLVYTLHGNYYKLNTVNSSLLFFNLISYTLHVTYSWVKRVMALIRDQRDPLTFVAPFDPLTHRLLCKLI